jgi:hypothetical protein
MNNTNEFSSIGFSSAEDLSAFTKSVDESIKVFLNSLENINDIELLILRTHLCIERLLEEIIALSFPYPKAILNERFNFSNKLSVIKALVGNNSAQLEVIARVAILNKIRNEMAHKINSSKLPELFLNLNLMYKINQDGLLPPDLTAELRLYLARIYGEVVGIKQYIKLSNEGVDYSVA